MEFDHSFVVPAGIDLAWSTLLDVKQVAPCMPGATLDRVEGDEFGGSVKVKVGPITMTYKGQARFRDRDDAVHTVVIEASGTESRGTGSARAIVDVSLRPQGPDRTDVAVHTDLNVTGRPAQFGRGVLNDVAVRLIDQFAQCLEARMAPVPVAGAMIDEAGSVDAAGTVGRVPTQQPQAADAIDLVSTAGLPVLKRFAPAAIGVIGFFVVLRLAWRCGRCADRKA